MAAKKKTKSKVQETSLRHLWLAGLGAIALARREAVNAANDAASRVESFRNKAGKLASETRANVRGGLASVREQGGSRASRFSADIEARVAPVLIKLGLKPKPKKATRGRMPVKKVVAKRTPARKPVAKRSVRKARG